MYNPLKVDGRFRFKIEHDSVGCNTLVRCTISVKDKLYFQIILKILNNKIIPS